MIIRHKCWGGNNVKHEEKTVRDFIDKVIMKIPNKEKKYFRICTKQWLDGMGNMVLYFQDGILKSHHTDGDEFNYQDVLDYELHKYYSIDDLGVDNIRSVECDTKRQIEQRIKARNRFHRSWHTEDMVDVWKAIERGWKEDEIRRTIKNKHLNNEELIIVVRQLSIDIERMDRKVSILERKIDDLQEENEKQCQQIKWLGKII